MCNVYLSSKPLLIQIDSNSRVHVGGDGLNAGEHVEKVSWYFHVLEVWHGKTSILGSCASFGAAIYVAA